MATSTWADREVAILEALATAEVEGSYLDTDEIVARTGLQARVVGLGLRALRDEHFIDGIDVTSFDDDGVLELLEVRLLGAGRRAVGAWPKVDADFEAFLDLVRERIESTEDEEEKTRLQRLFESARDVSSQVGTQLLVAWAKQQAGL